MNDPIQAARAVRAPVQTSVSTGRSPAATPSNADAARLAKNKEFENNLNRTSVRTHKPPPNKGRDMDVAADISARTAKAGHGFGDPLSSPLL